ncbi:MAG: hypothetical protein AB1467_02005 [Candidatus Diapherotrites archaeon]
MTVEFRGVVDNVLKSLVEKGYARTKAEAVRYALLHLGEELGLTKTRIHAKAEEYAYAEIRKR